MHSNAVQHRAVVRKTCFSGFSLSSYSFHSIQLVRHQPHPVGADVSVCCKEPPFSLFSCWTPELTFVTQWGKAVAGCTESQRNKVQWALEAWCIWMLNSQIERYAMISMWMLTWIACTQLYQHCWTNRPMAKEFHVLESLESWKTDVHKCPVLPVFDCICMRLRKWLRANLAATPISLDAFRISQLVYAAIVTCRYVPYVT